MAYFQGELLVSGSAYCGVIKYVSTMNLLRPQTFPWNLRPGAMWAYERSSHVVPVRIPTVRGTQVQVAEQRGRWFVSAVSFGMTTDLVINQSGLHVAHVIHGFWTLQ